MLYDSIYIKCLETANPQRKKSILVVAWAWDWGMTVNGHKWYFKGDRKILKLNCGDNCTTLSLY